MVMMKMRPKLSRYISDWCHDTVPAGQVEKDITLPCGATASFDYGSGISYRCNHCFATAGSIGMPQRCKDAYAMEDIVTKLKGKK